MIVRIRISIGPTLAAVVFWMTGVVIATDVSQPIPTAVKILLETRCLSCHNDVDREGEFSLQSRTAAFRDGYLVPHRPQDSHLLRVIKPTTDGPAAMPKDGEPLSFDQVRVLEEWIASGAAWPQAVTLQDPVVDDFDWWSLQPIGRPAVPELPAGHSRGARIRSPVDAFVRRQQLARGLTVAREADRLALIRRVTYDLTGLPPTPEELNEFLAEDRDDAWERLVERLLASPHYGERWGRHWLDVVKYADTCGYDKDKLRLNAWPYRNYVIQSFNDDKPYSRFVQEQIAGDVLFPGEADGILGLGFIAAGPWDFIGHVEVSEAKLDGKVARNLDRDDMVSIR